MLVKSFLAVVEADPNMSSTRMWLEGERGHLVVNTRFNTKTHFTTKAIRDNSFPQIYAAISHGKDIDHITRITGYFTRTSSWNKGKKGELADRHRSGDMGC